MDDSKPFQSLSSHSSILDDFENLTIDQSKACARVCQSLPLSSQTKSRKSSSPRPSHTITYSSPVQVRSRPPHVSREEYALLLAGQPATPSAADVAELRGEDANEKGRVGFLSLPAELRNSIYALALRRHHGSYHIGEGLSTTLCVERRSKWVASGKTKICRSPSNIRALLCTSKQIHGEVMRFLAPSLTLSFASIKVTDSFLNRGNQHLLRNLKRMGLTWKGKKQFGVGREDVGAFAATLSKLPVLCPSIAVLGVRLILEDRMTAAVTGPWVEKLRPLALPELVILHVDVVHAKAEDLEIEKAGDSIWMRLTEWSRVCGKVVSKARAENGEYQHERELECRFCSGHLIGTVWQKNVRMLGRFNGKEGGK